MAVVIVGTKHTVNSATWHGIGAASGNVNTQAIVPLTAQQPLLLHRLGVRARRTTGNNGQVQLAVWKDDNGVPGDLLGYTGTISIGLVSNQEHPLAWSHRAAATGQTSAAIALDAGQKFWLGIQVENAGIEITRDSGAASILSYRRQTSGNPPNPFGVGSASTATVTTPAIYGVAESDDAPVATLTQPAASVASAQPTIAFTTTDAQSGAPTYDRVRQWAVELREQGETDLIWQQTITPSNAERNAASFSTVYAGPVLSEGAYEVRVQPIDDAGNPGAFTGWRQFSIANLGLIDVSSAAPTGKIESGSYAGNFTARWTHPLALNADRAWVRILSGGREERNTAAATPGGVVVNVANNAFITLSQAQAAVALASNPLPPGSYTWQMQARATDGSLSPWSADVPLVVNSPPNQPSSLRPVSGTTHATRPLTDWLLSDPDLDDVLGVGLTSMWEITRPDGTQATHEVATVDPATGRGQYLPTASDMPVNTTTVPYAFRVRGRDVSAAGTTSEYGPWSPPTALFLVTAPIVTVTAPSENAVVATSQPQFAWTIADGSQSSYRVQLYRAGQPVPFFSSGQVPVAIPAASGSYTPPAGWLKPGNIYDADVTIWTAGGISSTSAKRRFSVQYADANLVPNVAVNLFQLPRDVEPTSVAVSWGATTYPASQFLGYVVWRRPTTASPDDATAIALIRAAGQRSWTDHHAPPNTPLVYAVSQLRRSGDDVQSSQPVEVEIEVPLTVPVVASLLGGADRRFPALWLNRGLGGGFRRDEEVLDTWGTEGKGTLLGVPRGYGRRAYSLNLTLRSTHGATVQERFADVRETVEAGDPVSLRTETDVVYCRIVPRDRYWSRGAVPGTVTITLDLEEVAWNEAVALET